MRHLHTVLSSVEVFLHEFVSPTMGYSQLSGKIKQFPEGIGTLEINSAIILDVFISNSS